MSLRVRSCGARPASVAFGAPIASLVGDFAGWRLTFLGTAVLVTVAGVLLPFVVPRVREQHEHEPLTLLQTARLPGVVRVAVGGALVMLALFEVLTYIDVYLERFGAPGWITSVSPFIISAGSIIGTLLIGQVASHSTFAALLISPITVAIGLTVLLLAGSNIVIALIGTGLWGVGLAAAIVVYQQAILLTGAKAPESATSIGVVLAQAGFAAGAVVGGLTVTTLGIGAIPLVALVFVVGSITVALTLRGVIQTHSNL